MLACDQIETKTRKANMIPALEIALDIFCAGILLAVSWILTSIAPLRRFHIDINEQNMHLYSQPVPPEEPYWVMAVFIWIIPIALISITTLIALKNVPKMLLHVLYFVYTAALVIFITALIRYFFPSPRPYYHSLCARNSEDTIKGYSDDPTTCKVSPERRDLQSFPSGHTSSVWGAWIYLLLVFTTISRAFSRKGGFYKLFLFAAPLFIIPIWMSGERYTSGNHFLGEVLIGSIIGIVIPFMTFYNVDADLFIED